MLKYSFVALATILIIGCGNNDNGEKKTSLVNNGKPVTIEGLKSFSQKSNIDNISDSKISKTADSVSDAESSENSNSICQSGSMNFNTDKNQQIVSFTATNCNDGYSTINGSAKMEMYSNDKGGFVEVLRDLTVKDDYFSLFAKKGSFVKIDANNKSNIKVTAGFEVDVNGEAFSASNLLVVGSQSENKNSFYIASGEMIVGEYYFKVDESYDSSKTPFVMDESSYDDSLKEGGLLKLLDGAGHKIEIEVTATNEVTMRVDENGDGIFSDNEIEIMDDDYFAIGGGEETISENAQSSKKIESK